MTIHLMVQFQDGIAHEGPYSITDPYFVRSNNGEG